MVPRRRKSEGKAQWNCLVAAHARTAVPSHVALYVVIHLDERVVFAAATRHAHEDAAGTTDCATPEDDHACGILLDVTGCAAL